MKNKPNNTGNRYAELIERKCKHGWSYHPFYKKWKDMKGRCYKKTFPGYSEYGGKGIKVCKRWNESFENFREDMYSTWKYGLFLLRINTKRNFTKSNCKWGVLVKNKQESRVRKIKNSLGEVFRTHLEASKKCRVSRCSITQCLLGMRKTAGMDKNGNPIKWFYCE